MQPLQHLIIILVVWCVCQFLPRRHSVHALTWFGLCAVIVYAPAAAGFILLVAVQACGLVLMFRGMKRSSNWRKYGLYLLLLNLFFVDIHKLLLGMPVATLGISFSTIRIFMTAKQLLNSRKAIPARDLYWIFPAAFFLPAIVIGPVFSGTELKKQARAGAMEHVNLRDYRMVLQGLVLVALVSPGFGNVAAASDWLGIGPVGAHWIFLFLQLFAAFWGQSLIAEHTSRFFGYRLPVNFDHPWKARTFKEFWARWHRSMANFVLQYIFLPLNLKGFSPRVATVVAFVFMGLWHNLSIGYLVWGMAHGVLLAYSGEPATSRRRIVMDRTILWITVISLSWFANYGPLS